MLLFNTQQDLENPFDMNGMDDVFFEMDKEMDDAWQPMGSIAGERVEPRQVALRLCRRRLPMLHAGSHAQQPALTA